MKTSAKHLANNIKRIAKNVWVVTIVGGIAVTYFGYFVLGIGKDVSQKQINNSIITSNQVGNNTLITNPIPIRQRQNFNASNLKNNFTASSSDQIVHLQLNNYPTPDSVEVWWGAMSLTPSDFWVVGKDIQVDLLSDQAKAIQDVKAGSPDDSNMGFVVTYIPDLSK